MPRISVEENLSSHRSFGDAQSQSGAEYSDAILMPFHYQIHGEAAASSDAQRDPVQKNLYTKMLLCIVGFGSSAGSGFERLLARRHYPHTARIHRAAGVGSGPDAIQEQWLSEHVQTHAGQIAAAIELGFLDLAVLCVCQIIPCSIFYGEKKIF